MSDQSIVTVLGAGASACSGLEATGTMLSGPFPIAGLVDFRQQDSACCHSIMIAFRNWLWFDFSVPLLGGRIHWISTRRTFSTPVLAIITAANSRRVSFL